MLRRLAAALLVVSLAGTAGGCGPPSNKGEETDPPCGTSMSGVHEKGPLKELSFGGNAPMLVRAGKPTPQRALRINLEVEGNQPITIDCVTLDPFPDLSGLKAPALPHMDAAHVVTAKESRPAKGYRLEAGSQDQTVWLLLTVSARKGVAFNQDTQVFYHTPDGTKYRVVYLVQFVLCVKGEVPPHSCARAFPRYVKEYTKEQKRQAA
jgi:hypothetical protein